VPDLEQQLLDLGNDLAWPATPLLAARIGPQLRMTAEAPERWGFLRTRWALAAAVILLALAALVAFPPSRDAMANWINLHVLIQRTNNPPTPSPLPPGPLGKRLGLGQQTTLTAAQAQVSWRITVPSSLGDPDEVYLQKPPDGPPEGEVTLVYGEKPGIPVSGQTGVSVLVTEVRGNTDAIFFQKMIGGQATLEEVTVKGHKGYWISGHPHVFLFTDADGQGRNETMRLATNTLIFDNSGTIVRIEGDVTKAQALAIANSLG
jgi:hypothetical protein